MDLIYTDSNKVDQGVLNYYAFDLSFGEKENNFEITVGLSEAVIEYGAHLYVEGTEYGGIVDTKKSYTNTRSITYKGRTWHGVLNSKIIEPDAGSDYYIVSGDANAVLEELIYRLQLDGLFQVSEDISGIEIKKYQFKRYCKAYDGIREMLLSYNAKLKIEWINRKVVLYVEKIQDYSERIIDGDSAKLTVEHHEKKVNHLICLGSGQLSEREVIHLYVNNQNEIVETQYYSGMDEYSEIYDNSNSEDLRKDGESRLKELIAVDTAEVSLNEDASVLYDVGDIIGACDNQSGIKVTKNISQKIIRITNNVITVEYK